MPSAQKVRWSQLRVGVMAIGAMVIAGVLIFLMTGEKKPWTRDVALYTYMDNSAALGRGAPVRLNGILVGKVEEIILSGEKIPNRIVKIHMEVEQARLRDIPVDSVAEISAENVLGAKFINISMGRSPQTVQPGAEVRSKDVQEFQELVQQGYTTLASLQGILKRVDAIVALVEVGRGSIGKLLVDEELYDRLLAVIDEGHKITQALSTPTGTIGKLMYDDAIYNDVRRSLARMDVMLDDLQQGKGTAGKLLKDEALYSETRQSIAEARKMLEDLNAGKGTAGKLLKSEELHNQIRATLEKVDLMVDKIGAGQGTIGQILVNRQLYDSLNGATTELRQLFADIRKDPKKFLRVKLSLF